MSQTLLGLNLILNVGALFGVSTWLESRDQTQPQTFTYYFYWVTLCLSLLISFFSVLFYFEEEDLFSKCEMQFISFIMSFLWIGSSFGLSFIIEDCFKSNKPCDGEFISITFSYPLAFMWFFIFCATVLY